MLSWRGRGVLTGRGWLHVKMEGVLQGSNWEFEIHDPAARRCVLKAKRILIVENI